MITEIFCVFPVCSQFFEKKRILIVLYCKGVCSVDYFKHIGDLVCVGGRKALNGASACVHCFVRKIVVRDCGKRLKDGNANLRFDVFFLLQMSS